MDKTKKRRSFMMSVDPDKQEKYISKITPIPPDLIVAMKENGIINYTIYLDPPSSLLFGYLEYESDQGLMNLTATQACQQWWKDMSEFMPSNPDYSPIASELKEVFHLD